MTMAARGMIQRTRNIIGGVTLLLRSTSTSRSSHSFILQNRSLSPPNSHILPFSSPHTSFSRHFSSSLSGSIFFFLHLHSNFMSIFSFYCVKIILISQVFSFLKLGIQIQLKIENFKPVLIYSKLGLYGKNNLNHK